ncbi:flagellar hook-associated protein FlgK [Chitinilyticum litopenaei]|uniref:flagellar hook-associated protein FlgK n=1 Tax=Chitinilyticum litopenaei TaxID=1121276 RepID=UPI0004013D0E|nr:flagellar hook-associated protein FlgK [Chitinilyticum litopenaei]
MGSSVFGIGVSGLNAANLGLTTTGHNIANVNTDGYSRQNLRQSAPYPLLGGSGFVGMGVRVDTIARVYDQFLTRNVQQAQTQASFYDTYLSHLSEIDNIVADPDAGVSPALQDFFSSVQNVATNPSNLPSRQQMLASAQTMLSRYQVFEQRLQEQRNSLNGEITNTVNSINALAKNIAEVNNQIALTNGAGQPANDLLDKRDQLVRDMNKLVKATTLNNSDGTINVFIGSGQSLVLGGRSVTMTTAPSPADPERLAVVYDDGNNQVALPDSLLTGGELGALLDYRNKALDLAQNSLNRMALVMAQTFNDQHQAGMDLYGNRGGDFWDYGSVTIPSIPPTVPPTNVTPPAIGRIGSNTNNTGTATMSGYIADVSQLTTSDYEVLYDGTNYVLTRLSDNAKEVIPAGNMEAGVNTQDGLFLQITPGLALPGDRFMVQPTKGFINSLRVGISDPREIAAAGLVNATPDKNNTGTIKVFQPEVDPRTNSTTDTPIHPDLLTDLNSVPKLSYTLIFNGTPGAITYEIYDSANLPPAAPVQAAQPYTAGAKISFHGWSMKVDGQPAAGDKITVSPNTATGNADNRNALALASLQTTRIMDGQNATYQEAYGRMVATIGTQTNEADIMAKAQGTVLSQAEQSRDSVSAVNLDEEAANLLRYQQAYQAASKVIQIAQQAFQEIINIGR